MADIALTNNDDDSKNDFKYHKKRTINTRRKQFYYRYVAACIFPFGLLLFAFPKGTHETIWPIALLILILSVVSFVKSIVAGCNMDDYLGELERCIFTEGENGKVTNLNRLELMRLNEDDLDTNVWALSIAFAIVIGLGGFLFWASINDSWFFGIKGTEGWDINKTMQCVLAFLIILDGISLGLWANICHTRKQGLEDRIRDAEFQAELDRFEDSKYGERAVKLFRINEYQLERYYKINIKQNSWIFFFGLACVLVGFLMIGVTFYFIFEPPNLIGIQNDNAGTVQILIAALGAVGTLATNFVAAMYLNIYSKTAQAVSEFHGRLVKSHGLFLGNMLASHIKKPDLRDDAFRAVAVGIASGQGV